MKTISITKAELELIYHKYSAREACEKLGVTLYTFYKALDAAGIARKAKPYNEQVSIEITD